MKQEAEVAMRLLEKDGHDKHDLVASLRKQLEDVKNINIEMHNRLQVCSCKLSDQQTFLLEEASTHKSAKSTTRKTRCPVASGCRE